MKNTNIESLIAWETNAEFWDNQMGNESNSIDIACLVNISGSGLASKSYVK